jgi:hypothetical protein
MMAAWSLPRSLCADDAPMVATRIENVPSRPLLQEAFPGRQWVYFTGKKDSRLEETWSVDRASGDPVLVCRGEPHGYIRTADAYTDFQLGLEWKYPSDENGNSGILVYTSGEDKLWPTAVQVQLHKPKTGSILPSGGADVRLPLETKNHFSRPVNQWNELVLTSSAGNVALRINGKEVGTVSVATPQAGSIGLQSEGSEVHFRKIWVKDLRPVTQTMTLAPSPVWCLPPTWKKSPLCAPPAAYAWGDAPELIERRKTVVNGPGVRRTREIDYVAHRIPLAADGASRMSRGDPRLASAEPVVATRRDSRRSDRTARRDTDSH